MTPDWNAKAKQVLQDVMITSGTFDLRGNVVEPVAAALAAAYQQGREDVLNEMAQVTKDFTEKFGVS